MSILEHKAIEEAARISWAEGNYRAANALRLVILLDDYADDSQFWKFISLQAEKAAREKLSKK